MKAKCSKCERLCTSAATDKDGLCVGCRYLPKGKVERTMLNAPAECVPCELRRDLLLKEAKRRKVGETISAGGQTLVRVDARQGNHQHWNIKAEQKKIAGF